MIFKAHDEKELASRIIDMIEHPEIGSKYSQLGQERALKEFNIQRHVQQIEKIKMISANNENNKKSINHINFLHSKRMLLKRFLGPKQS